MRESDPTDTHPEEQDPESSAAADAPSPEERPSRWPPAGQNEGRAEDGEGEPAEGPPTDRLHEDPAYDPGDSGMKDIKGG